jgi:hypothetical protein
VMYKGRIIDTVPARGTSSRHLGLLMAGIKPSAEDLARAEKEAAEDKFNPAL